MVLTKEMLDSYLDSNRISINTEKYKKILYELGTEQDEDYSWTDQDMVYPSRSPALLFMGCWEE